MRFFWQAELQNPDEKVSILSQPISTEGAYGPNGGDGYLSTIKGTSAPGTITHAALIKSGSVVELKTEDPEKLPLPSFELLQMQFFLQRVCGMAGTVGLERFNFFDENEDDDDDSNPDENYYQ